jgi:hypothetical protein
MEDLVIYIVRIMQVPIVERAQQIKTRTSVPRQEIDESGGRNGRRTSALTAPRNAWLFQSNPTLYDLRGALRTIKEQVWSVSRYAKEIERGDRIYLWEAGREGGIAGVAEITEPARLQPEPPEQLPFARVAEAFAGTRLRARLRILRIVEPVITRHSVASTPGLSTLGVLRCSRGTNFRLSLDQWQAMNSLIVAGAA